MNRLSFRLAALMRAVAAVLLAVAPRLATAAEIHDAVARGDLASVEAILTAGKAAVDERMDGSLTPLHVAAALGRLEIAKLLIDFKAEPNARSASQEAPLHLASWGTNYWALVRAGGDEFAGWAIEAARSLATGRSSERDLRKEGRIRDAMLRARDPAAALAGKAEIVRLLLANGADVEARNAFGQTPLHLAAQLGSVEIAERLLEARAQVNARANGMTPLCLAAATGIAGPEFAALLLDRNADANAQADTGWSPLAHAANWGNAGLARMLLSRGADPGIKDRAGYLPLHTAAERGREAVVALLLDAGSDVNARIGRDLRTPLHKAAQNGDAGTVELLIKRGASVNAVHFYGQTALHEAVMYAPPATVRTLLANGADPNIADSRRRTTPLHVAAMVRWISAESKRQGLSSPLAIEPRIDQRATVELLIRSGAKVDARDSEGMTPLGWATAGGMVNVVELLASAGADVNAVDQHGATPLEIAIRAGQTEIAAILRIFGARTAAR